MTTVCQKCNLNIEDDQTVHIYSSGCKILDHISFCGLENSDFNGLLQKCLCCDKFMPLCKLGKKKVNQIMEITGLPIHDKENCNNYVDYRQVDNKIYIKVKKLHNVSPYLKKIGLLHYRESVMRK